MNHFAITLLNVLFFLSSGLIAPGANKSPKDIEREQAAEQRRAARQALILHEEDERKAREDAAKQKIINENKSRFEAERKQARAKMYATDLKEFYNTYVSGKYYYVPGSGRIVKDPYFKFKVIQIPKDGLMIVEMAAYRKTPALFNEVVGEENRLFAITGYDTSKVVDGSTLTLSIAIAGTFRYVSVGGGVTTIKKAYVISPIGWEEFSKLTKTMDILRVIEAQITQNDTTWQ